MIPQYLRKANIFHEGTGTWMGQCSEAVLPKLTRQTQDYDFGNGPVEMDMGIEKLEMSVTHDQFMQSLLDQFGLVDLSGVGIRFEGAMVSPNGEASTKSVTVVVRGRWKEIDLGTYKYGNEKHQTKSKLTLSYFKIVFDGDESKRTEIDLVNHIEVIGGVDRLADVRAAIGV